MTRRSHEQRQGAWMSGLAMQDGAPEGPVKLAPPGAQCSPGGDPLAGRLGEEAAATWRAIDGALSPIIGARGFAALYQRCLSMAHAEHPWLAPAQEAALQPGAHETLRQVITLQTADEAAAAAARLLEIFKDLLARLIGIALSERLLLPVWPHPTSRDAAQDNTP